MYQAIEQAVRKWVSNGVPLQPPLSPHAVITNFERVDRTVSADVATLYSLCNGMAHGDSTSHFFSLWPLEQCLAECPRFDQPFMPFADFLLSSHEYCFFFETSAHSSVFIYGASIEHPYVRVADSVEEFFSLLLHSPKEIHAYVNCPGA